MKQHFQPHVPTMNVMALSLEEEAIALSEDNDTQIESNQIEKDQLRLVDISKGIGDVQQIIASSVEVSQVDQDLISAVADMTVSGTDIDPAEILEQTTATDGVVTESFLDNAKSTIVKLWESIKALMKKAWDNIKKFFSDINNRYNPRRKKYLELQVKLKEEQEDRDARMKESEAARKKYMEMLQQETMEINEPSDMLFIKDEFSNSVERDVVNTFTYLEKLAVKFPAHMVSLGKEIERAVSSFQRQVPLEQITNQLAASYNNIFKQCSDELDFDIRGRRVIGGRLGDLGGIATIHSTASYMTVSQARNELASVVDADIKIKGGSPKTRGVVKVRPLSIEQSTRLMETIVSCTDKFHKTQLSNPVKEIESTVAKIQAVIDKCVKDNSAFGKQDLQTFTRLCSKYNRMATSQCMSIPDYASRVADSAATYALLCQRHRKEWEKKNAQSAKESEPKK